MSEGRNLLFDKFIEKFVEVGGEFYPSLSSFLNRIEERDIACQSDLLELIGDLIKDGFRLVEFESASIAITRPCALVVETGSLIYSFDDKEEFKLISLPYIHVNILDGVPIFETLEGAIEKNPGKYISIVTGPSKTGDIELIHVFGVHGPGRLIGVGYVR